MSWCPPIGAPAVWWMRGFVAEPYSYVVLPQRGINAEEQRVLDAALRRSVRIVG
jgi:hypothetical protein